MSVSRAQILASTHHSSAKGARVVLDSRARAERILDEPGTTCSAKHEEVHHTERGLVRTARTPASHQPQEAPKAKAGTIRKINNDRIR